MNKEELFKKYQEIVLRTNGGNDDYVVALCQISDIIKEFAETQDKQFAELKAENERLKEVETLTHFQNLSNDNRIKSLQQQLKEKDEEIAFLKENDTKLYKRIEDIKLNNDKQLLSSLDAHQRVVLKLIERAIEKGEDNA